MGHKLESISHDLVHLSLVCAWCVWTRAHFSIICFRSDVDLLYIDASFQLAASLPMRRSSCLCSLSRSLALFDAGAASLEDGAVDFASVISMRPHAIVPLGMGSNEDRVNKT